MSFISSDEDLAWLTGVTRFEVIDHRADGVLYLPGGGPVRGARGRVLQTGAQLVGPGMRVDVSLQDGGYTLKVFLSDEPPVADHGGPDHAHDSDGEPCGG